MRYKCTNPDCPEDPDAPDEPVQFSASTDYGEPEVCPFCGVESVEQFSLFGRGVADNH